MRLLLLLLCFTASAFCQGTMQHHVTFDGPPTYPPGSTIGVTSYSENGMRFTAIGSGELFTRGNGGVSFLPENGTSYLIFGFGDSLAGTNTAPYRFGLMSVELSEFSTLYQFPKTIQFIGYLPDGNTVTTNFTTDGIVDGTGPLPDFEKFVFDERFADLTRFEVADYGYAMDNLVFFDVIPEPTCGTLVILGGVLVVLIKRARN